MPRPPRAREKILDTFERIVNTEGERAATMDATARLAGVSKGGLLYHFASKQALEAGLVARLAERTAVDVAWLEQSEHGPLAAFIRSSIDVGSPFDHTILAVTRLAHDNNEPARAALAELREAWKRVLRPHVSDELALGMVMLISDGLYLAASLGEAATSDYPTDEASLTAFSDRVTQTFGIR